jgi:hypothetical protein
MKNRLGSRCFDVGDESAGAVQQSAMADKFATKTGGKPVVMTLNLHEAFAGGFCDVAEVGKRLLLGEPVGGFRERKRDGFEALGHDGFHVMIEANIAVLAHTRKGFSASGNTPAALVAVSTDRKHGGADATSPETRCAFSATGKFARARKRVCDISAKRFVTQQAQSASFTRNTEAAFAVSHSHAPKLRLGETHVPERLSSNTR